MPVKAGRQCVFFFTKQSQRGREEDEMEVGLPFCRKRG